MHQLCFKFMRLFILEDFEMSGAMQMVGLTIDGECTLSAQNN